MTGGGPMRFLVISTNEADWGGSEELWAGTALALREAGHRVVVAKPNIEPKLARIAALRRAGCSLSDLQRLPLMPRAAGRLLRRANRFLGVGWQALRLLLTVLVRRPQLALLSQGANWDGFVYAMVLRWTRTPYVVVAHKASELAWPAGWMRPWCRAMYRGAVASCFVSRHTRQLTGLQVGIEFAEAPVVRNPFLADWDKVPEWPAGPGLRLACVGRMWLAEKGQDVLLRVLASDKWRARDLRVSFYGHFVEIAALREMTAMLGLTSVSFHDFTEDVDAIWREHHALVLPSRVEGLPLVIVEAMMSGRVPIITDVGGCAEIVSDGQDGFVAAHATPGALDEAMERAWARRGEWQEIGARAAVNVRRLVPPQPAAVFAEGLVALAAGSPASAVLAPRAA